MCTVGSYGIIKGTHYWIHRHFYDMYPHGHISDLLLEAAEIAEAGMWDDIADGWTATIWHEGGWENRNGVAPPKIPSWRRISEADEAERDWLEEPSEWGVFAVLDDRQLVVLDFWDATAVLKIHLDDASEMRDIANSFAVGRPSHGHLSKYATRELRAAQIEMVEALGGDTDSIMPLSQLELHCGELQYGLMPKS